MCGILGIVGPPESSPGIPVAAAIGMRDRMANRGPDDAGLLEHRNVLFAHRRLAIRDREGGAQPWCSHDGMQVLVYNGEVYDDGSLRRELVRRGHVLTTQCDTELVMAAYREWGRECVTRLRGMFAFGVYDYTHDTLLLARDRCGVKPLFVAEIDGRLVFASSIPAILAHPRFTPRPNWPVVSHYLSTLRLVLRRQTVYEGIWQLLPGERLELRNGEIEVDSYWQLPFTADDDDVDVREAAERVGDRIREATRLRLVSDVPVGMFASGGVDSNTLARCVRDEVGQSFPGFCGRAMDDGTTIGNDDHVHTRRAAETIGFDYGEATLTAEGYRDHWDRLLEEYATPLSTPSDPVILRIAEAMRPNVGVAIGGEGADELFCGYAVPHWTGSDAAGAARLADGSWTGPTARLFRSSLQRQYGRDTFASEVDLYFAGNSVIPTAAKPALLRPEVWREAGGDEPMYEAYGRTFAEFQHLDANRRHQAVLHRVNLEALLARLDTATMSVGLEARVPFTDHCLVEETLALPHGLRIDVDPHEQAPYLAGGELARRGSLRSKRVLREVASGILPSDLAQRPKASFPTPLVGWLGGVWADWVGESLRASPFAREMLNPEAVEEIAANPAAAGLWTWPLLNVCRWGDRHAA